VKRSEQGTGTDDHALLTPEEAAARLRVAPQTVYRLARAGKLPGVKVGHLWRIRRADLEAFLAGTGSAPTTDRRRDVA
jgi:excisionase family DNA binding protein